jgi:hypothetical protein
VVVAKHPDPDTLSVDVIQNVVWKALQVTAPKPAPIKMETPRVLGDSADSDLKLGQEILPQLMRDVTVLPQNLVQIRLNPPVEPKFHVGEARQRVRQK